MLDLRLGDWSDVLSDFDSFDAVITDPPYGKKTHDGTNKHIANAELPDASKRSGISYEHLTSSDVQKITDSLMPKTKGWFCVMTSHDLLPHWEDGIKRHNLYGFAPIPIIQKRPRLRGDGPASWTVWMMVARRRNQQMARWGCLPGMYQGPTVKGSGVTGAKPIDLMRAIVRDYSRPGWLICDPFAGSGTTLMAAAMEGRQAVGVEVDPKTYQIASERLSREFQPSFF